MKDKRLIDSDRNERFSDKHMYNKYELNTNVSATATPKNNYILILVT